MRRFVFVAALLAGVLVVATATQSFAASTNGSGGNMPAYYDGQVFTINFKLLKPDLHSNPSFNVIYQCDSCATSGLNFVSVLDAIQGDGFNPIWEEVQITFNPGFTPVQLTSDTDVLAAAAQGEITLTDTEEFYRCSVVGPKKKLVAALSQGPVGWPGSRLRPMRAKHRPGGWRAPPGPPGGSAKPPQCADRSDRDRPVDDVSWV